MEFKITVFWLVMLLFVLHTFLSHWFNWRIRKSKDDNMLFLLFISYLLEFIIITVLLGIWLC
jgi:hypothetical protein